MRLGLLPIAFGLHALWGQSPDTAEFFESHIRPVLIKNCLSCHAESRMGGLRLDSREQMMRGGNSGPAVKPGNPDESLLIQAVSNKHERLKMPMGGKLAPEEISNLTAWVKGGASWPDVMPAAASNAGGSKYVIRPEQKNFWAFQPVRKPAIPELAGMDRDKIPIDRFIFSRLDKEGLKAAQPADKRTLIRRATFDLIGLPPTPEEVDGFLSDTSNSAFAKVVDRLLASPHYGERWGRYWLDLARYSDSKGVNDGQAIFSNNAFRYRDWVVQALNEDMPYNVFIKAQLAADLFPEKGREKMLPALGFHALGPPEDDRVDVTTRTFLALTVGCAKCHDHKFDPVPTLDYYSLDGIFKSSESYDFPLAPADVVTAYNNAQKQIKEKEAAIADFVQRQKELLAEILLDRTAEYMVAAWKLTNSGKGRLQAAATEAGLDGITLDRWVKYLSNRDREHPFLTEWDELVSRGGSLDAVQTFASKFQQLVTSVNAEKRRMEERNFVKLGGPAGLADRKLRDTINIEFLEPKKWSLWRDMAGDPCKTGGCQCGLPFAGGIAFYGDKGDEHHGYYKLAEDEKIDRFLSGEGKRHLDKMRSELATLEKSSPPPYAFLHGFRDAKTPADVTVAIRGDEKNPGEVAPRRFLQILSQGEPERITTGSGRMKLAEAIASPDNPLTARVIVNRVWHHHFGQGIVRTVSNFGHLGERPSHPELLDYLAWRFVESGWSLKSLHREIMLSAAYAMSTEHIAGNFEKDPDNRLHWRANLTQRLDVEALRDSLLQVSGTLDGSVGGPPEKITDANRRRMIYASISRTDVDRTLLLFDFPDPSAVSEQRAVTVGPLQRLYFMNSDFVMSQSRSLVKRLNREAGADGANKIRRAYQLLFSRPPTSAEIAAGIDFLSRGGSGWEQYAQVLLASTEFSSIN